MELVRYRIQSHQFGEERAVTVVLPEAYDGGRRRYPVLYLHDGSNDWLNRGRLLTVLETVDVPEMIVVLPEPVNRTQEYKLSRAHVRFLTQEIIPWTDATFRTRAHRASRAVHGVSLGGLVSVSLGLHRPELFAAAGAQGGAFWYWKGRIIREFEHAHRLSTRFYISCGRLDGNLNDNRALHEAMRRAAVKHTYDEVSGRHSWACWHRNLAKALVYYFGRRRREDAPRQATKR